MRIASVAVAAAMFVLALCSSSHADQIWSDGFESGNFSAWSSASGNWTIVTSALSAHNGIKGADIKGTTNLSGDILSVHLSSVGFQNLEWQYWYKVRDGLELVDADSVFAEWTANGTDWLSLDTYANSLAGGWQFISFALPAAANENSSLGFRFRATLGSSSDRMNFDDFALSGTPIPEPSSLTMMLSFSSFIVCRFVRKRKVPPYAGLFFCFSYTKQTKGCKM